MNNPPIPTNVQNILNELVEELKAYLSDELVGVYLHGSLTMGGFNPVSSDIDLLIIVRNKLSLEYKKHLAQIVLRLSKKAPAKGFELSVVTINNLENFIYPTPYEFHFSYDHIQKFKEGKMDFSDGLTDSDLAAHFVITKKRGLCLFGEPTSKIFPNVPKEIYLDSIKKDSEESYNNISKSKDIGKGRIPTYAVLNFCRVIALIKENLITSKLEGGEWALNNLPEKYKPLIAEAIKEKRHSGSSKKIDVSLIKSFATYSITIIRRGV